MIDRWYDAVLSADEHDMAMAIAALGGMVKGYGETRYRTTSRLMQILDYVEHSPDSDPSAITASSIGGHGARIKLRAGSRGLLQSGACLNLDEQIPAEGYSGRCRS